MTEFSPEDRQAICETFERLLSDKAGEEALRNIIETEAGFDKQLWEKMAELGLLGILIPSENEGLGGGIEEIDAIMVLAGAALYSGPYIPSCVLAPTLLEAASNGSFAKPFLKNIATGKTIFAIAGCGASGDWTLPPDVIATKSKDGWTLQGEAHFVVHARNADEIIVAAMVANEMSVFSLPANAGGLIVTPQKTDDQTLRLSSLSFDNAQATRLESVGRTDWEKALKFGLVALAAEQSGATRRIFDMTIEYLNTRFQFGQPIGRFQALKHMAADLLIDVESSSSVARHTARALAAGAPTSSALTYLAAFTCADNFRKVAAEAIQLHGGIAYTMEHSAHLYWRRAQTGQWLFGPSDKFRDLYLSQMEKTL